MLGIIRFLRQLDRLLTSLVVGLIGFGMLASALVGSLLNAPNYDINVLVFMGLLLVACAAVGGFREFKELME